MWLLMLLQVVKQNSHPATSSDDVDHNHDVHWSGQSSSALISELLQTRAE